MSKKWIARIGICRTIPDNIEYLQELYKEYPDSKYEIRYDNDNEMWIVDTDIEDKEEDARIKHRRKETEREEKALLAKLHKKYMDSK